MTVKRKLALVLAAALCVSLCGCFNVTVAVPTPPAGYTAPNANTYNPTNYNQPTNTYDPGVQPSQTVDPVPQQDPNTQPSQNADPGAQEDPTAQQTKTPDQMTNAELLNFFNSTLNRIKTDKVGFKKSKLTSLLDLQLSNSLANTVVGAVKSALLKETADETVVQRGEDGTNVFSPSGKPYISTLAPADITGITCQKSGNNYVITVNVKNETNPEPTGSAMSRGFDFITVDDVVNIYAPKVGATVAREDIRVDFSDCRATLVVGADGRVQSYQTYVKGVMNMFNAKIKVIKSDVAITLASTTDYTNFQY